jgi:hypothetical protein
MALTVTDLFENAPSGVGPYGLVGGAIVGAVPQTPGSGSWLASMLQVAATVQLPTTSWQSGAPERTIFAAEAVLFSLSDANISQMAQGGFLQSAASGTVTYTTPQGTTVTIPVTPDPSNASVNPTGAPGYLDLLAANVYDVTRLAATYVTGQLAIAKTSSGTLTYGVGAYHVGNTLTGATYHNIAALSIPSSIIAGNGGVITAVTTGFASTTFTTLGTHGLTQGQSVYITMPASSGITLSTPQQVYAFAIVSAVGSPSTFSIGVGSSGTYTSGGNAYLCTVATMEADVQGIGSNAGLGNVTTAITQNANVFIANVLAWSGSNWESNSALANRCVLSLAARSPNGPSQAYVYFAESAYAILQAETPPILLTAGPVQAVNFSNPQTNIVTTVVGSASPISTTFGQNVTPGVSQLPISGVTNANPAVITCTGPTSLSSGTFVVTIDGVLGPTTVNGTWTGTYVSADSFSIPLDTTTAPSYISGGQIDGGDLGQIDNLLQVNCVPDNTTAITASALALPIQVTATVVVPTAYVSQYTTNVALQLQAQIASYAIGGNASSGNAVNYDDIVGALTEAGVVSLGQASYATIQSLSINSQGVGVGVAFPSSYYQAILSGTAVTVLGV